MYIAESYCSAVAHRMHDDATDIETKPADMAFADTARNRQENSCTLLMLPL
jgi:hypothetical protein